MANPVQTPPSLTLYFSSISSSIEIKKHQQNIDSILTSLGISYIRLDISTSVEIRTKMRELVGDDKALPPQICNGDTYCGDFAAFEDAIEREKLKSFLKLE